MLLNIDDNKTSGIKSTFNQLLQYRRVSPILSYLRQ